MEQLALTSEEMVPVEQTSPVAAASTEDDSVSSPYKDEDAAMASIEPLETSLEQEDQVASPFKDAEAATDCVESVPENESVSSPRKTTDAVAASIETLAVTDSVEKESVSPCKDEIAVTPIETLKVAEVTEEKCASSPRKNLEPTANGVVPQTLRPVKGSRKKPSAVRDYPEGIGLNVPKAALRDFPSELGISSLKADAGPKIAPRKTLEGNGIETSSKIVKVTYVSPKERAKMAAKASKVQEKNLGKEDTAKSDVAPASTSAKELSEKAVKKGEVRAKDKDEVQETRSELPLAPTRPKEQTTYTRKVREVQVKDKVEAIRTSASIPAVTPPQERGKRAAKGTSKVQSQEKGTAEEAIAKPEITPKSAKRSKPATPNSRPSTELKKPRRSTGKGSRPASQSLEGMDSADSRKALQTALRLFDAFRRNLLQQEEINGKESRSRADLTAGALLNSKGLSVNRSRKNVGSVPGLEVGDHFYFRMEMACIGMHGPIQAGIDYLTAKENEWNAQVAISIISSGDHDDDRDDGEQLIYTGQGGKSSVDSKAGEDQKLERGNLALDGSKKHGVPVRVVRGLKDVTAPSGKIYTYDGLYKVESSWSEKGKGGFEEFKFKLLRMPDQPELGSAVVKLVNKLKSKPSLREGLLLADISQKRENVPVCVVNTVDDEEAPALFEYSTKVHYPPDVGKLEPPESCECKGACKTSKDCLCFSKNGNAFPYINSGHLVRERDIIFECGSHCKCSPTCRNRVTQKGITHHLEIFKTENRGWGVRAWDPIPAGSFICEYTGKAINNVEVLEDTGSKDYSLNVKLISRNESRWGDVSSLLEISASETSEEFSRPDLLLDASETGNVARFINHSCSPNLFAQCVFRDHNDPRFPHIMLFAMDNIPPLRELTLDYGSDEVGENDTGFHLRSMDCLCGSADCRGKIYY